MTECMNEPNDQMGSPDSPPYAALWVFEDIQGTEEYYGLAVPAKAMIVTVDEEFRVGMALYSTDDEIQHAWGALEKLIESPHPASGDFVIWQDEGWFAMTKWAAFPSPSWRLPSMRDALRTATYAEHPCPDVWLAENVGTEHLSFKLMQVEA